MSFLQDNLRRVQDRIAAVAARVQRLPEEITLIAVTKSATVDQCVEALRCGIGHLGENRVQDAACKWGAVTGQEVPRICWHMMGHLQTNKVARALAIFQRMDSLDRWDVIEMLEKRLAASGASIKGLIEVKLSTEPTKTGVSETGLMPLLEKCRGLKRVELEGLMTIAPWTSDQKVVRGVFQRLRALLDDVHARGLLPKAKRVLSMGMSADYEMAIEEGATEIRIGRALFGERGKT